MISLHLVKRMRPGSLLDGRVPSSDAGLARMAYAAGMDFPALVSAICEAGARRQRQLEENRWALSARLSGVVVPSDPASLELFAAGVR